DWQLDLPDHERLQSYAHHPGTRLYERRRDRQPLPEEPRIAALTSSNGGCCEPCGPPVRSVWSGPRSVMGAPGGGHLNRVNSDVTGVDQTAHGRSRAGSAVI